MKPHIPIFCALTFALFRPGSAASQGREQQTGEVTGRVSATSTGRAVPGVSVWLRGSAVTVTTDSSGQYRIVVPAASSGVLVFSHVDYDVLEVRMENRAVVDASLRPRIRLNQYAQPANRTNLSAEVRDGTLVFESADEQYRFWFDIRVQTDAAVFDGQQFNKLGNGVALRRSRIGIKANLTDSWYGELDVDFSKSSAEVKDMYLQHRRGRYQVKAGNFRENISLERNTSSRVLTFMERPTVTNALVPDRNLGLQGTVRVPHVLAFGGIHFQDTEDNDLVTAREDNNQNFGQNEGYSLSGKFVGHFVNMKRSYGLHIGTAASHRTPKTDDVLNTVRFDTRSNSNINRKKFLDTDRITGVEYHNLTAAEIAGFIRGVKLHGEYTAVAVHRRDTLPTARFNGGFVAASGLLFGGRFRYDTISGEFTQQQRGRKWGDIELAGRYEYLDLTSAGIVGGSGDAATIGINWLANANVKLMFNFSVLNHDRYANGRNRLFVGHDSTGALTTNPARVVEGKGKAGENYRMFAVRFEVDF